MKAFLHRALPRLWARRGPLACLLWPLSLVFAALSGVRRALYRAGVLRVHRLPVPVVVVGNISVGGSGKTPVVIHLCERLRALGFRPGVVSRGYGAGVAGVREVSADSTAQEVGDEPLLIAWRAGCPVFVSPDRVSAGQALLARHPEVNLLIADDGLQHLALARDIEVVVSTQEGLGNGFLLPAGPLREPVSRLEQADAVLFHGPAAPGAQACVPAPKRFSMHLTGSVFQSLSDAAVMREPGAFSGQLHALAGLGQPARFFDHLTRLGLTFTPHPFPDHHPYSATDLAFSAADAVLMTEKDAVKCAPFARPNMWVLRVDAAISPDLVDLIVELLNGRKTA